jgi:hypothetical protein
MQATVRTDCKRQQSEVQRELKGLEPRLFRAACAFRVERRSATLRVISSPLGVGTR